MIASMTIGRPTDYRAAYAEGASKLARLGATDDDIAAWKAAGEPEDVFYEMALRLIRSDRDVVIAARKRARNAGRKKTPSSRIRNATSARIWAAIKGRTDGKLFTRLGYSVDDLMAHLASLFQPGMTFEKYGKWHVAHVRPCASFNLSLEDDFSECWGLENLQPLWAHDNVKKGASYGTP